MSSRYFKKKKKKQNNLPTPRSPQKHEENSLLELVIYVNKTHILL
jgi:hypothetical protein